MRSSGSDKREEEEEQQEGKCNEEQAVRKLFAWGSPWLLQGIHVAGRIILNGVLAIH